jgi:hypothetical protein
MTRTITPSSDCPRIAETTLQRQYQFSYNYIFKIGILLTPNPVTSGLTETRPLHCDLSKSFVDILENTALRREHYPPAVYTMLPILLPKEITRQLPQLLRADWRSE